MDIKRIVNRRRAPIAPVPGMSLQDGYFAGDEMFTHFGLNKYVGCVTGEAKVRPIPQAFQTSTVSALTQLYSKHIEELFSIIIPELEVPIQTLSRVSKRGYPLFTRSDDPVAQTAPYFKSISAGDLSSLDGAFIIMNVRLQPEDRDKVRVNMIVTPDGVIEDLPYTTAIREIHVTGLGLRVGSRVRLVFNFPIANLVKQVVDTAIHKWFMRSMTFRHDMYNGKIHPVRGYHMALDVKNFDRHIPLAARVRAQVIGGVYHQIVDAFSRLAFACPTSDWKSVDFLYPNRAQGWSDQYGSGDSGVAPIAKEIFMILFATYIMKVKGYSFAQSAAEVLRGGIDGFTIRNYGDDNSFSGDETLVKGFFDYAANYLTVEEENPPKFLGFVWYPGLGWKLPVESYLTKTWLPERGVFTPFREVPNLGWVEKRINYVKYGHPDVASKVFPFEDRVISAFGNPWSKVLMAASKERMSLDHSKLITSPEYVHGKEYLLTDEEKIRSGLATALPKEECRRLIKALIGQQWQSKLRF